MPFKSPQLAGRSTHEIYEIVTAPRVAGDDDLPRWPEEAVQKRYTGCSGIASLRRAANFVDSLARDGAFARPDWKALDYGCGWGRIATYMLTRGAPEQLDMCDAWPESLSLAAKAGFKNRLFKVSDVVQDGEIAPDTYDFCYALSVFTHLDRSSFESNIAALLKSLKKNGRLYFTVRQPRFVQTLIELNRCEPGQTFTDGFWHLTYPNRTHYGETAVEQQYVEKLGSQYGEILYLGVPEHEQHLYRISRV